MSNQLGVFAITFVALLENLTKSPNFFDIYLANIKFIGRFSQIFVIFLENLNCKDWFGIEDDARWLPIFMHCRNIFQHIWPSAMSSHLSLLIMPAEKKPSQITYTMDQNLLKTARFENLGISIFFTKHKKCIMY